MKRKVTILLLALALALSVSVGAVSYTYSDGVLTVTDNGNNYYSYIMPNGNTWQTSGDTNPSKDGFYTSSLVNYAVLTPSIYNRTYTPRSYVTLDAQAITGKTGVNPVYIYCNNHKCPYFVASASNAVDASTNNYFVNYTPNDIESALDSVGVTGNGYGYLRYNAYYAQQRIYSSFDTRFSTYTLYRQSRLPKEYNKTEAYNYTSDARFFNVGNYLFYNKNHDFYSKNTSDSDTGSKVNLYNACLDFTVYRDKVTGVDISKQFTVKTEKWLTPGDAEYKDLIVDAKQLWNLSYPSSNWDTNIVYHTISYHSLNQWKDNYSNYRTRLGKTTDYDNITICHCPWCGEILYYSTVGSYPTAENQLIACTEPSFNALVNTTVTVHGNGLGYGSTEKNTTNSILNKVVFKQNQSYVWAGDSIDVELDGSGTYIHCRDLIKNGNSQLKYIQCRNLTLNNVSPTCLSDVIASGSITWNGTDGQVVWKQQADTFISATKFSNLNIPKAFNNQTSYINAYPLTIKNGFTDGIYNCDLLGVKLIVNGSIPTIQNSKFVNLSGMNNGIINTISGSEINTSITFNSNCNVVNSTIAGLNNKGHTLTLDKTSKIDGALNCGALTCTGTVNGVINCSSLNINGSNVNGYITATGTGIVTGITSKGLTVGANSNIDSSTVNGNFVIGANPVIKNTNLYGGGTIGANANISSSNITGNTSVSGTAKVLYSNLASFSARNNSEYTGVTFNGKLNSGNETKLLECSGKNLGNSIVGDNSNCTHSYFYTGSLAFGNNAVVETTTLEAGELHTDSGTITDCVVTNSDGYALSGNAEIYYGTFTGKPAMNNLTGLKFMDAGATIVDLAGSKSNYNYDKKVFKVSITSKEQKHTVEHPAEYKVDKTLWSYYGDVNCRGAGSGPTITYQQDGTSRSTTADRVYDKNWKQYYYGMGAQWHSTGKKWVEAHYIENGICEYCGGSGERADGNNCRRCGGTGRGRQYVEGHYEDTGYYTYSSWSVPNCWLYIGKAAYTDPDTGKSYRPGVLYSADIIPKGELITAARTETISDGTDTIQQIEFVAQPVRIDVESIDWSKVAEGLNFDFSAPTLAISRTKGNDEPCSKFSLTVTVKDDGGLADKPIAINGQEFTGNSDGKTATYTAEITKNGEYLIQAIDSRGNIREQTVKVTNIDDTAPEIKGFTQTPTVWVNGNQTVAVTANAEDAHGIAHYTWSFAPMGSDAATKFKAADFKDKKTAIVDCSGVLTLTVTDYLYDQLTDSAAKAKHTATSTYVVTNVDRTAPGANVVYSKTDGSACDTNNRVMPADGVVVTVEPVDKPSFTTGEYSGMSSGLAQTMVRWDGVVWTNELTKTFKTDKMQDGNPHYIEIRDAVGNISAKINLELSDKFLTNASAPSVTLTYAQKDATVVKPPVTLKAVGKLGTGEGAYGSVDKCYSWDGGQTWISNSEMTNIYANGVYQVMFRDAGGNTAQAQVVINNLDAYAPSATMFLKKGDTLNIDNAWAADDNDKVYLLFISATDVGSGIKSITHQWENVTITDSTTTVHQTAAGENNPDNQKLMNGYAVEIFGPGTYAIVVEDYAGNKTSVEKTVTAEMVGAKSSSGGVGGAGENEVPIQIPTSDIVDESNINGDLRADASLTDLIFSKAGVYDTVADRFYAWKNPAKAAIEFSVNVTGSTKGAKLTGVASYANLGSTVNFVDEGVETNTYILKKSDENVVAKVHIDITSLNTDVKNGRIKITFYEWDKKNPDIIAKEASVVQYTSFAVSGPSLAYTYDKISKKLTAVGTSPVVPISEIYLQFYTEADINSLTDSSAPIGDKVTLENAVATAINPPATAKTFRITVKDKMGNTKSVAETLEHLEAGVTGGGTLMLEVRDDATGAINSYRMSNRAADIIIINVPRGNANGVPDSSYVNFGG